jgi:hypothetical protein
MPVSSHLAGSSSRCQDFRTITARIPALHSGQPGRAVHLMAEVSRPVTAGGLRWSFQRPTCSSRVARRRGRQPQEQATRHRPCAWEQDRVWRGRATGGDRGRAGELLAGRTGAALLAVPVVLDAPHPRPLSLSVEVGCDHRRARRCPRRPPHAATRLGPSRAVARSGGLAPDNSARADRAASGGRRRAWADGR